MCARGNVKAQDNDISKMVAVNSTQNKQAHMLRLSSKYVMTVVRRKKKVQFRLVWYSPQLIHCTIQIKWPPLYKLIELLNIFVMDLMSVCNSRYGR